MNFENPKVNNIEKKEIFDEAWYERMLAYGNFEDYEYFEGKKEEREKQKKSFLEESIRNPDLAYPKLDSFDFKEKEKGLLELKKDILEKEENEAVKNAYRWRINEKLAKLRMLRCSKTGDDRKFSKYSKFIYGAPDQNIFDYELQEMGRVIEEKEESDDVRILFAIKRLKEEINLSLTDEESIQKDFLPPKKRIVEDPFIQEGKLEADGVKEGFVKALGEYQIDGWDVIIEEDITAISVSQKNKKIRIPQNRKLSESKLKELIAHEIGTHVLRRENRERSKLRLLGLGLDRNLRGEEGISTFEEQKIGGADDFAGLEGHLAISLAVGLDGKKRDFREVFNILRDYFFIKSKEKDLSKSWESAKSNAWNRCVRTFRGTSCKTEGVCLARDMVYREGNIGIWNLIKNNPNEERRFSIGKYDPTNSRHIWILEQLGITDEDLQELEKE